MRVTTDLWVSAVTRRVFAAGGFAAIVKRGATEAGAVMIVLRGRFGTAKLYAPAPQTSYADDRPQDRLFGEVVETDDDAEIQKRIDRELRFDPDLWVIELEVDEARFREIVSLATS